jgi:peroxiredoxin
MRVYQKEAGNLAKHNVTLAVVSPSAGPESVSFAKDAGLDLLLLADPENKVAALFDAVQAKAHAGNDIPLPCSFLIGPDGKLAHSSRPDDIASFLDPGAVLRLIEKEAPPRTAA